jgi:hypothetical protein
MPGWGFIVLAVSCAVSVLLAYRGKRTTGVPLVAGVFTILWAIPAGLAADLWDGSLLGMETGAAGPGLGIYAQLAAGLLMVVGGLLTFRVPAVATLVLTTAAAVVVVSSTWWLTGLDKPLSPHAGMLGWGAPGDTPRAYSKYIAGYCRSLGVERTAMRFEVAPTAEVAAVAVAGQRDPHWWEAAYNACLQGFRDRR